MEQRKTTKSSTAGVLNTKVPYNHQLLQLEISSHEEDIKNNNEENDTLPFDGGVVVVPFPMKRKINKKIQKSKIADPR